MTSAILLIDDRPEMLNPLKEAVEPLLNEGEAEVIAWLPERADNESGDARDKFNELIEQNSVELVITDYDLTRSERGLFGPSIVQWCQFKSIPAGDYTNDPKKNHLPPRPNLFELRVPSDPKQTAKFVVAAFRGFRQIRERLETDESLLEKRSPSAVIAAILGAEERELQFAQYSTKYGFSNSALLAHLMPPAETHTESSPESKRKLLAYICGHLLLNSILKYPGPILDMPALAAYVAVAVDAEQATLTEVFARARYNGPFSDLAQYYWTSEVDEILEELSPEDEGSISADSIGGINRRILEAKVGRKLTRHNCERCGGERGGFICPLTKKVVCQLGECSSPSNSWTPEGARFCRIERVFFDEWAPILDL
ncbi:hypothetical protein [Burkholderia cepacia]|uniref:hypothetical protein n=2 Tax=Burkholderia cepacia complex TaxID=87882 RepID=UPI000A8DF9D8|nr:hypothetical protein [Burkholderia cepacia]